MELACADNNEGERITLDREAIGKQKIAALCLCTMAFLVGILNSVQLAIVVPESLKLGLSQFQAQWILSSLYLSSFPTMLFQPSINKWRIWAFAIVIGITGWAAFGVFYFSSYLGMWYLYVGFTARLVGGTAYYLLCNKIIVGMTRTFRGNVAISSTSWEVAVTSGNAVGAYLGCVFVNIMGFSNTMLFCACLFLGICIILIFVFPTESNEVHESSEYENTLKLHFLPDLIGYGWGPQLCIGSCIVFVEGNIIYFYMTEFTQSLEFGGVVLGISSIVYSLTSFISGYIGYKKPSFLPGMIAVGLTSVGIQLMFLGPVLSINSRADLWISVTSFNVLLASSSLLQYGSLSLCAKTLSELVGSEEAMSIAMNVWYLAKNIGSCTGPVIAGAFLKKFSFRIVFALGAPFFLIFAILPCFIKRLFLNQ